jgi:hypothetical protein
MASQTTIGITMLAAIPAARFTVFPTVQVMISEAVRKALSKTPFRTTIITVSQAGRMTATQTVSEALFQIARRTVSQSIKMSAGQATPKAG